MSWTVAGTLTPLPVSARPDLLAEPVRSAFDALPDAVSDRVAVVEIDPGFADTAALCEHYGVPLGACANCVIVTGKREGVERIAACLVLATTRADVNGLVRRHLNVRKASFAAQADAVERTGMEYGGITPVGLPSDWALLVDGEVALAVELVVGSGLRRSKLLVPGDVLTMLPNAVVLEELGRPTG